MTTLTLKVTGPEIVCDLLVRALAESEQVLVVPDSIAPGYVMKVVSSEVES